VEYVGRGRGRFLLIHEENRGREEKKGKSNFIPSGKEGDDLFRKSRGEVEERKRKSGLHAKKGTTPKKRTVANWRTEESSERPQLGETPRQRGPCPSLNRQGGKGKKKRTLEGPRALKKEPGLKNTRRDLREIENAGKNGRGE